MLIHPLSRHTVFEPLERDVHGGRRGRRGPVRRVPGIAGGGEAGEAKAVVEDADRDCRGDCPVRDPPGPRDRCRGDDVPHPRQRVAVQTRSGARTVQAPSEPSRRRLRQEIHESCRARGLHVLDHRLRVGECTGTTYERRRVPVDDDDDRLLGCVRSGLEMAAAVQPFRGPCRVPILRRSSDARIARSTTRSSTASRIAATTLARPVRCSYPR